MIQITPMVMAILSFVLSLIAVLFIVPPVKNRALRAGFVDAPGGRKKHDHPIAPIGGLVIFTVIIFAHIITRGANVFHDWALYIGLILLLGIGAWDDRKEVPAGIKFSVQILVATISVIFGSCLLDHLGPLFGGDDFMLGVMAVPFSIAAVALMINAINLMDGLDGLSGGVSFVISGVLFVIAMLGGSIDFMISLAPILGALAGFLYYNMRGPHRSKAMIFMGDAGTLAIGFMLAWQCIDMAKFPELGLAPIAVAWVLAIPIMDECAQFYRRVREGQHPFSPDRGHFHHHFIDAGFSAGQASLCIIGLSALLSVCAIGLLWSGISQAYLTWGWIITLLLHMEISRKPARYIALLSKIKSVF